MMNTTANASTLGYAAFALSLWMTGMIQAGWFAASDASLGLLTGVVLGGVVMAIAGCMQYLRGHALDASLFLSFAGFWWIAWLSMHGGLHAQSAAMRGWYEIVWAFLAFCFWLAARKEGTARMLFALGLCLLLLAWALAQWLHLDALTILGGYLALVTSIVGIYIAAAELINETHGHAVLPLGENNDDSRPS